MGNEKMNNEKEPTELQVIREHCLECQGADKGSMKRVRECPNTICRFWRFRTGHRPKKAKSKAKYHLKQERSKSGTFMPILTEKKRHTEVVTGEVEQNRIIHDYLQELIKGMEE